MTKVTNDFDLANRVLPVADKGAGCTIVVPCYNEEKRLNAAAFLDYIDRTGGVSFLFVNDGSHDATADLLRRMVARRPDRVAMLDLPVNGGKAEAVRQGLLTASAQGAELLGYWDADLATPLSAIDDFRTVAGRLSEVEVVFGSRRQLLGHRISRSFRRRAISRLCAVLARQVVCLPVGDTQCGAKLLRNSPALRAALAAPFEAGWLFDVELFARLARQLPDARAAFYELPLLRWTEIEGSKVTGRAIARAGVAMLKLIARNRLGLGAAAMGPVARRPELGGSN